MFHINDLVRVANPERYDLHYGIIIATRTEDNGDNYYTIKLNDNTGTFKETDLESIHMAATAAIATRLVSEASHKYLTEILAHVTLTAMLGDTIVRYSINSESEAEKVGNILCARGFDAKLSGDYRGNGEFVYNGKLIVKWSNKP